MCGDNIALNCKRLDFLSDDSRTLQTSIIEYATSAFYFSDIEFKNSAEVRGNCASGDRELHSDSVILFLIELSREDNRWRLGHSLLDNLVIDFDAVYLNHNRVAFPLFKKQNIELF